jgi:hypothetical protein
MVSSLQISRLRFCKHVLYAPPISTKYGRTLSKDNLEMTWVFLHESVSISSRRPLASCLQQQQQQLYFEPCPASCAETISMYTKCFVKCPNQILQCFRIPIFKWFSKKVKSFVYTVSSNFTLQTWIISKVNYFILFQAEINVP